MMSDNDMISRAAAIDAVKRAAYWNDAERKITELPAVDAVPVVHGRWITHKTPSGHKTVFERCSICKTPTIVTRKTPYCPNCGARMDGDGA